MMDKGASLRDRAGRPTDQAAERLGDTATSDTATSPSAGKMSFLLRMVEADIQREGETASFMVRSGLLRDILIFAIAAATGTAKTPQSVECEASQSGPKGIAKGPAA